MNHAGNDKNNTIATIQEQFETWRSTRTNKREPIPGHLWQAAVSLCREYSIARVCRELRLSYTDLKKKALKGNPLPQPFIEIDTTPLAGPWRVECSRSDGSRLFISGNGQAPSVEAIVKSFLS